MVFYGCLFQTVDNIWERGREKKYLLCLFPRHQAVEMHQRRRLLKLIGGRWVRSGERIIGV